MFTVTKLNRRMQNVVCTLISAVIVAGSLTLGAYGSQSPLREGYSVTVTQVK